MTFEQAEDQLRHLSSSLLDAAERDEWEEVASLHGSLQGQLIELFSAPVLPGDHRPATLLTELQQISEDLSQRAQAARNECAQQLDSARNRRQGMSLYQETANHSG